MRFVQATEYASLFFITEHAYGEYRITFFEPERVQILAFNLLSANRYFTSSISRLNSPYLTSCVLRLRS
jgi:hypothetical protein